MQNARTCRRTAFPRWPQSSIRQLQKKRPSALLRKSFNHQVHKGHEDSFFVFFLLVVASASVFSFVYIDLPNFGIRGGSLAYIQFLGAAGTVTGSKHLVNLSGDPSGKHG